MCATACSPQTKEHTLKSITQSLFNNSSINKMATLFCEKSSSVEESCYINLRQSVSVSPFKHNLGELIMLANYAADDELQQIMALIKQPNRHKTQKLTSPWREKISTSSCDLIGFLFTGNHLVVPKAL